MSFFRALRSIYIVRWPITATAITKRNTIDKENLTNKNVSLTCKKGLLPYKQDLLTYTKKYSLTYPKNPRQIATANSHGKFRGKFPRQIPAADSRGKQPRQILAVNSRGKFLNMQYKRWCGAIFCVGELHS